jgi:hypothetical protein
LPPNSPLQFDITITTLVPLLTHSYMLSLTIIQPLLLVLLFFTVVRAFCYRASSAKLPLCNSLWSCQWQNLRCHASHWLAMKAIENYIISLTLVLSQIYSKIQHKDKMKYYICIAQSCALQQRCDVIHYFLNENC